MRRTRTSLRRWNGKAWFLHALHALAINKRILLLSSALLLLGVIASAELEPGRPTVSRAMGAAAMMAFLWVTTPIPVAVTAMMPLALFPALGILSGAATAKCYMSDTHFVFIGSFFLANAVERVQLHRRIALGLIGMLGVKARWLLVGFCVASFGLSTCLSNTATAIMVIPLAFAVLDRVQLRGSSCAPIAQKENGAEAAHAERGADAQDGPALGAGGAESMHRTAGVGIGAEGREVGVQHADRGLEAAGGAREKTLTGDSEVCTTAQEWESDGVTEGERAEKHARLRKAMALGVAYSANLGGCCTLTGTPPNLVFASSSSSQYLCVYVRMSDLPPPTLSRTLSLALSPSVARIRTFSAHVALLCS